MKLARTVGPQARSRPRTRSFNTRSFKDSDYVYVWVDGIHLKVRLGTHPTSRALLVSLVGEL